MKIPLYKVLSNNDINVISCNEHEDLLYINNEQVYTNDDVISAINLFDNNACIIDIKRNDITKSMLIEVERRYLNNELKDNELLFLKYVSLDSVN